MNARRGAAVVAVVLMGVLLLVVGPVSGQPVPAHPADLTYALLDFTPPEAGDHRHVLSNGVVVFVVEDHELPLVSLSLTIRTGNYLDPPDKIGLASLTGSQMRAGEAGQPDLVRRVEIVAGQDRVGQPHRQPDACRRHNIDECGRL